MDTQRHIVIVGAGQAGFAVASALRQKGLAGRITLFGDEPLAPYQRPPLSKAFLLGRIDRPRLLLKPGGYYPEQRIDLVPGARVEAIHPARREIVVAGRPVGYDDLVLATGAEPRRFPGAPPGAVHVLRSFADAEALGAELRPGRRLLMIGGGYIGLELAAVARERGLEVTVVEAAARILHRVAAPETSDYFRALHQRRGVRLIEGAAIGSLAGGIATLADGRKVEADVVVCGIGVVPRTDLAERAGIAVENGIRVDGQGRTSAPHVWAAGDCCSFPWQGQRIRLESVPHAIDQATALAGALLGEAAAYEAQPWFWSDQYDVKLQTAGLNHGYDRSLRQSRDGEGRSCAIWYFRGGRAVAVDAINDARTYMAARRAFRAGAVLTPEEVERSGFQPDGGRSG